MLQKEDLILLTAYKMPFGKYKDMLLIDVPEEYLLWFQSKGFPDGELGRLMSLVYEIKLNGLEDLFDRLR